MKHLKNIYSTGLTLLILFITITAGTGQQLIAIDEGTDTGLSNYERYTWDPRVNNPALEESYVRDRSLKLAIQDAIMREMSDLGYTMNSGDPDFYINYKVLKDDAHVRASGEKRANSTEGNTSKTYDLKAGTLVIQLLSREKDEILWQGFASDVLKGDDFISQSPSRNEGALNNDPENEKYVKQEGINKNEDNKPSPDERAIRAVQLIFDKFEYSETRNR